MLRTLGAQIQHYRIIICKPTVFCNLSLGSIMALVDNDKSNLVRLTETAKNQCHNYFIHVNSKQFLKFIFAQTQM